MIESSRPIRVQNLRNQKLIADNCRIARSFFQRLRGLIGKKKFHPGEGLWFGSANSIHMWFMSIPIDVVFLKHLENSLYTVTSLRENLRPWRLLPVWGLGASDTLELPVGTIRRCELIEGDTLECIS